MKRFAVVMVMMAVAAFSFAQTPEEVNVEKLSNGYIKVAGVDALGADVTVLYNSSLVKVYQERTANDETTYARFHDGKVVDYGTFTKPMANNAEIPEKRLVVDK